MLIKNSLSRSNLQQSYGKRLRLLALLTLLSLLTSCTTFIPGLDRILFANSSAKVGPLVDADEKYPANSEEASATSAVGSVAETENDSSAPIDTAEPKVTSAADSEPTIKVTDSQAVSIPSAREQQVPKAKAKPVSSRELESPKSVSPEVVLEKENPKIEIKYGAVAGKIVLINEDKQQLPAAETLITLTPSSMINEVQNRRPQVHIIDMQDKVYLPRYSTVHVGDQVVFVNKDNIQHNVFSSSGNNAFDLGTYGMNLKRAVTLKEPGIVKIYCNIHSDMATFVAVSNQGLSTKADEQGRYKIDSVLPGTYEVAIWNIRGETKRIVEVKADDVIELVDRIDTAALKVEPHKNKFGGKYSKSSTLFEDEFY